MAATLTRAIFISHLGPCSNLATLPCLHSCPTLQSTVYTVARVNILNSELSHIHSLIQNPQCYPPVLWMVSTLLTLSTRSVPNSQTSAPASVFLTASPLVTQAFLVSNTPNLFPPLGPLYLPFCLPESPSPILHMAHPSVQSSLCSDSITSEKPSMTSCSTCLPDSSITSSYLFPFESIVFFIVFL